jgi:HEAT repeat protein
MRRTRKVLAAAGMLALGVSGLQGQGGARAERLADMERALASARAAGWSAAWREDAVAERMRALEGVLDATGYGLDASRMSLAGTSEHLRAVEARLARQGRIVGSSREARARALDEAVAARTGVAERFRREAPEAWLPQDPADSLYRAARASLNASRFQEAAGRFAELRQRFPRSGYVGDAFYFQALALYRAGGPSRMEQALELLQQQAQTHPDAATAEDARALQVRVQSELARRGDASAAAEVARSASADCDDEDQSVRATALSALLQMDAEQAVPILREVLRQRDGCSAELRKQAVFLLSQKMTDETVGVLVDLAQRNPDPDPEVRDAAIFWLSQTRSEAALDALLSILESDGVGEDVRERVVFAVAQHRSPRAAEVLRNFARNASAPVELRSNAIFWLGQQGGADAGGFLRELYGSLQDPELKDRVLFSVSQSRSPENRAWLLARARDTREDVEVRKKALFWAGQAGLGAQEALEVYRSSTDRAMKEQALFVLTQVREGRAEAVDALMEIARTEQDGELRQRAIFWLGQSKDPRAAELLLEIIRGGGG